MNKESSIISSVTVGKNADVYKGILELASRFGYLSVQEVEYLTGCSRVTAMNRLHYLAGRKKLLQKFDSLTRPANFYSLTYHGREMVQHLGLSDELNCFVPSDYRLFWQNHQRLLIRTFIAFRKMFGSQFAGWVSESQLRKEYTQTRVVDGEFYLNGLDSGFRRNDDKEKNNCGTWIPIHEEMPSKLKCWVELELSLKSPARYRDQFKKLADQVYDSFSKVQIIHHLFFLSGSQAIQERLKGYVSRNEWGECGTHFLRAHEFFSNLGETQVESLKCGSTNKILMKEIMEARQT